MRGAGVQLRLGAGNAFGTNLLTLDEAIIPTPDLGWETWSATTCVDAADPLVGELLRVELLNPGGPQRRFDNVRLTALAESTAVPEPSTFALSTVGLLGLALAVRLRRRRT